MSNGRRECCGLPFWRDGLLLIIQPSHWKFLEAIAFGCAICHVDWGNGGHVGVIIMGWVAKLGPDQGIGFVAGEVEQHPQQDVYLHFGEIKAFFIHTLSI